MVRICAMNMPAITTVLVDKEVQGKYISNNMSSLDIYPIKQEQIELLGGTENFWNGVDDTAYKCNILEEAARSSSITENNNLSKEPLSEVSTLNTPPIQQNMTSFLEKPVKDNNYVLAHNKLSTYMPMEGGCFRENKANIVADDKENCTIPQQEIRSLQTDKNVAAIFPVCHPQDKKLQIRLERVDPEEHDTGVSTRRTTMEDFIVIVNWISDNTRCHIENDIINRNGKSECTKCGTITNNRRS